MCSTRISKLFGVRYPIVQGGMAWVSKSSLVAAVAEAGALGLLGASTMLPDELKGEIRATRARTAKPFGVNLSLVPVRPDGTAKDADALLEVILDERVPIVFTSAGSPARFTPALKARGVTVAHVVPSLRLAEKAIAAGVDAVVAEGTEAGGHIGSEEISTLVLVPLVARRSPVPVIAAGGIADARGVAAAFALGAEGVQLGTRFVATHECDAHPAFKQAIVDAGEQGTAVYGRSGHPSRALRTPAVERLVALERAGAPAEEVARVRGRGRARAGSVEGVRDEGIFPCGSGAALVDEVRSVAEVISSLVEGYGEIVGRLPRAL